MRKRKESTDNDSLLLTTADLQRFLGVGYGAAVNFSKEAGAIVHFGKSLRHDRAKIVEAVGRKVDEENGCANR